MNNTKFIYIIFQARLSAVKIGAVTIQRYLRGCMNFHPHFTWRSVSTIPISCLFAIVTVVKFGEVKVIFYSVS
jgi:hypothetical protein